MDNKNKGENDSTIQNEKIRDVHDSMLEGLGQLADYFGFSKVMGQLYGTLVLSANPLSLDDMMERLGISKASVSMNMRTLEHMGMVRQVWVRGGSGRRKYYEAETDFWQIITNLVSGREMRDVERAITVIDENSEELRTAMPKMSEDDQHLAQLYIERMREMQSLFRFAQMIISTVFTKVDDDTDFSEITHIEID
jgi:HTH-type transcriptional regulator, glycine betaine synthesis regulator